MDIQKLLPEVYMKESRDFSYMSRVFQIIFNYMKTNADLVDLKPTSEFCNSTFLDLICTTLGFESKHNYITKDLVYIISSFIGLLKMKGSIEAIELIIKLLCTSQGREAIYDVAYHYEDGKVDRTRLDIFLPAGLKDMILMEDLFEYILPAGVIYSFIFIDSNYEPITSKLYVNNNVSKSKQFYDYEYGTLYNFDAQDDIGVSDKDIGLTVNQILADNSSNTSEN